MIKEEEYWNHIENKLFRIIYKKIILKSKPKILDCVYDKEGHKIGIIGGVNTENEEKVHNLIYKANAIKDEQTKYLILEQLNAFGKEELKLIENQTNLKILDGMKTKSFFLPIILKEIYTLLKESLKAKEVLILGDDEELAKEFILSLYNEVKFVTLVGENKETIEDISKYILEKTGLSIFHSQNIDKILNNYTIIINFKDNTKININKIKRNALVFDFSLKKELTNIIDNIRGPIVIEDFIFKIEELNLKESKWISNRVKSSIYEYFHREKRENLEGLLVEGEVYTVKDLVDNRIKNKGRL